MSNTAVPMSFSAPLRWRVLLMACMCAMLLLAWPRAGAAPNRQASQILFVEDNIADYRQLLAPDMDVVVLDGRQDGLRQIAQALATRRDITGLHLISHGGPGALKLGALELDRAQLSTRAADMDTIRAALRQDADILLYGCNVAEGKVGQAFIGELASRTGARVAASTDPTGAAAQGGNWILEHRTAPLRTAALSYPRYRQLLPSVAGTIQVNTPSDWINFGVSLNDNEADNGDIAGISYDVFFADSNGSPSGTVATFNNGLGAIGTVLIRDNSPGSQTNESAYAFIMKSQVGKFKLTSFLIQDFYGMNSNYIATPYLNGLPNGATYAFTVPQGGGYASTISLPAQFASVTEVRITSDGGTAPQPGAKNIWQGFNNIVFADPILHTNANLSALALSAGTLSPVFAGATTSYTASVSNATSTVTLTPTVADSGRATVTVNGINVASGAASGNIALAVGANTVTTIVTAEDGNTNKTYTVTITRAAPPSSNANLSNLALSQGTLAPVFASGTTSYTASVAFASSALTVTPTVADATASVMVNGVPVTSGNASGAIALAVGANTITTIVTAQDSSTKTYTTTVTRAAASGNNQLSALSLSSGTLAPVFSSATTGYTTSVGNGTTSITVTPTVADATASITVNGVGVSSGNASGAIALAVGSNTITVTVVAQNGTPLSYTITVTRGGSANADLSGLSLSSGTLSPVFAAGTTSYTASVSNATTSITTTPTASDASASITVNGVAVASGNASGGTALNVGSNTITTVVTAQDGTTIKTYTVTVTRAGSSNNDLSALTLSSGTLSPVFAAGTTSYAASIATGTASITVTPSAAVGTSSITVNGVAVSSGAASGPIAMNPGSNTVTVVVTAQNSATKSYTVTITRALPSSNADLAALSLSSGTLSPAFAAATTSYSASVGNATTSITATPTVSDGSASVTVNGVAVASGNASGAIALAVGANTITTVVTAQDGSTLKTYTVTVTRAGSGDANLSAMTLSSGTLAPAFAPATTSYTVSIAAASANITLTPTVNEPNATVMVNGVIVASGTASGALAMSTGANTVSVVVSAQNGSTKTYTVTVTRAVSTNNDLAALSLSSGTLTPVFSAPQQNYSATVPNATATLSVTPTVADGSASVSVNGVAVASGAASGAIALNVGPNVIGVVVTAQDGTPRTYSITVTRNVSSNADLNALTISSGTLAPAFSSATTAYTASVANAASSVTLTPTAANNSSSITINGVASASGATSAALPLAVGANTITVVVTAQDGVTSNTYTVSVTRAAAAIAELSSLSLSSGTLAPAFSPATTTYSASVDNGTASISLTPLAGVGSITVNGVPTASGNPSAALALAVGSNSISVVVTAPNGVNSKTYTITVTRAAAANADLAALAVPGAVLTPAFAPGVSSYALALPAGSSSINVIAAVADANARLTVNGVAVASGSASPAILLAPGSNSVLVSVTAANGSVKTYTISATRAVSDNAGLGSLVISGGTLSPAFASATTAYTVALPNGSTSVSLTPAVLDASASITVNGVAVASGSASAAIPLAVGSNTITIVVTAQSGKKVSTTVSVTRAPPPSASLAGLVYTDSNNDGINNSNEAGLAGVTVKLDGTDVDGATVELSTVTGSEGRFAFENLKGGNYTLTEIQPASRADGKETAGNLGGTVDNSGFDASAARNRIANIVLAPGAIGSGYLFGEQNTGTLQGFVYVDANNNGVKDSGEAGLSGVRVTLSGSAASVATSGADGSFAFPGLSPGNYTLKRSSADVDGARYADGQERAGIAGGKVNNANFGTQAFQASIAEIGIDGALLASSGGQVDGYLFGLRPRDVPGLKLPIVSGTITLGDKPMAGTPGALVAGWNVNLSQNGQSLCTVQSNAQGQYQLDNLVCAGYAQSGLPTGSGFALEFSKPGSNLSGTADSGGSAGNAGKQSIRNLSLSSSDEITQQNLALKPTGIVYDAISRQPLAGVTVLVAGPAGFDAATHLAGGQNQVTGSDGAYQVQLQNAYPSGVYTLSVGQAGAGYGNRSALLPACAGTLNVGATPDPALVQSGTSAPGATVPRHDAAACAGLVAGGSNSTQYYLRLQITNGVSAALMNNHIPLDAAVAAGLALSKTGDRQTAELGDTVRYTIVLSQGAGSAIRQASVRDLLPAGFRYVPGSATLNGARAPDPTSGAGSVLGFQLGAARAGQQLVLSYRARVGVGSMQGDGINRAWAYACNSADGCLDPATLAPRAASVASNEARFQVKVSGGVFTNDACVAGKVFADCNRNGMQDAGEAGIPGVRLYLEDGTNIRTDNDGKYSYCGLAPVAHVIKVDPASLPAGSTMGATSNRNLGDPDSLLLDVRNGELIRADFAETSCAAAVQERIRLARPRQAGDARAEPAPPPTGSPGITFSTKVKSKVNTKENGAAVSKPAQEKQTGKQGEHHAQ
jgi:LEA14-like dessication related protein